MLCILIFFPRGAEGEATFAKDELEEELRRLKQQLSREAELRAKEAKEFADRLKEVLVLSGIHAFASHLPQNMFTFHTTLTEAPRSSQCSLTGVALCWM